MQWKRILSCFIVIAAMSAAPLIAAESINSVHIFTEPAGFPFTVDDHQFDGAATLLWPAGSKHNIVPGVQCGFTGAVTNFGPILSVWAVTADKDLTYIKLLCASEETLYVSFFTCSSEPGKCQPPGYVYVNGAKYQENAKLSIPRGSTVSVEAHPNPGYVLVGWGPIPGATVYRSFVFSFVMPRGPVTVAPLFKNAQPAIITIDTSPPGMTVLADQSPVDPTVRLEWGWNTTHIVGALPSQRDGEGKLWVFDSWSDGGAINHSYTVEPGLSAVTFTARFVPGVIVDFLTDPVGLKLKIDGRDNWQNNSFVWAAGTKHTVSAAAEQFDSRGRKYKFRAWDNAGSATQEITVPDGVPGLRLLASYDPVSQLKLTSVPPGVPMLLDGNECRTPCAIERPVGVQVRLSAPAMQAVSDGSRLVFQGWTDSTALARSLTTSADPQVLQANYQLQHQLSTAADPPDGALLTLRPSAADGFYDAAAQVAVALQSRPGFNFMSWEGDLAGKATSAVLNMDGPKAIRARLDPVPYVPQGGIRNAAAESLVDAFAPGSLISIFGVHLAPWFEPGPEGPLVQTIAGVTLRSGDRLLPLLFVSPEQVNAQLPFDTREGQQTLTLRWEGKPEIRVPLMVVRNAPGLFNRVIDGRPFGLFLHQNGDPISPDSPAKRGETVTLLGTGLGPYNRIPPDGFLLPEVPDFQLADPVQVVVGDSVLEPVYAGAATTAVGMNAVRFPIGSEFPQGSTVELKIRVNGAESNTVLLPVE